MSTLTRWDPLRDMEDWTTRLNRHFGRDFPSLGLGRESMTVADWAPAVDIAETAEDYVIKAELPEVKKQDVKVSLQDDMLTIRGERKLESETKNKKLHRIERSYGKFERSFMLPDDVAPDGVHAEFLDGMLYVKIHKTGKSKSKTIEVKVD